MPHVPGLRSCYVRIGRVIYLGRMLDKIRLHAAGALPVDYQRNLGSGFDGRCCTFLGIDYGALRKRVLEGGSDQEILAWCEQHGRLHTDDEYEVWSRFMSKIGWRDARSPILRQRIVEYGLVGKPIETFFDLNDFDEGRDPILARAWDWTD